MNVLTGFYPGSAWWTFAASIIIQITVISGLALVAIKLSGRRRPALRHAVGLTALMVVLLTPLIAWSARQADMAPIPAPFPRASAGAGQTMALNEAPLNMAWADGDDKQSSRKIAPAPELPWSSAILSCSAGARGSLR